MSDESLVGQLLMVAPPDGWLSGDQAWLDELQPSGVILFRRNLPADLESARKGIARLHAWAAARGETFLVAMDEEGGFVTQTSQYMPTPPSARALAWAGGPEDTHRAMRSHGRRLRALGVNVDFAPVCDVNNNPRNPVIGVRSFGNEPGLVSLHARAVQQGLTEAGVLSCAKHFPGHGDTDLDSHLTLPVLHHERPRLDAVELVPFRDLLGHVPCVMVAHLACPKIGDGELPATLSPRITTELLRHELGFEGVAVTDAMDMQGVAGVFGVEEAAVRAMLAGCDLLLYCFEIEKPVQAKAALCQALESGRLPRARVEQAVARLERMRAQAAVGGDSPQVAEPLPSAEEDAQAYRALCRKALRIENAPGWQKLARDARAGGLLVLASWQEEITTRVAQRVRAQGLEVVVLDLEDPGAEFAGARPQSPCVVLMAERRPLAGERVEGLRRLAKRHPGVALLNVLTPEVDAPLAQAFPTTLRTADASDAMLDVAVERLLAPV